MIWYGNPCDEACQDAIAAGRIGCITTPDQGNMIFPDEWDVIADNGCFGGRWGHRKWFSWLLNLPRTIRFAVAPDVFNPSGAPCHEATLDRWQTYGPLIERHGFRPAFVCQVGATPENIPQDAPVVFLGGTTEWKLGRDAGRITKAAHDAGKWVHMGRVNTRRRLICAIEMGCDSADGTRLTFGADVNLPVLLRFLDEAHERAAAQPPLDLFG